MVIGIQRKLTSFWCCLPRSQASFTRLTALWSSGDRPDEGAESNESHALSNAPPLGGYVATSLKGTADMVLLTHQEDPLLATWRYGLGRTAAFTSDATAKWAVLWMRWGGFNKFWSQLPRWTLRTGTRSDTVAAVQRNDETGEIVVDAVDPKGEFINFLDSQVGVVAPDKQRSVVELEQVGPGRYRGRFPAAREGVYLVAMSQRRGEQMVGSQLAGLVVPYSQEFKELGVDEALLRELSELTGGGVLAQPRDAFLQARRRSRLSLELWPWLVGLVAAMLIPEIALRRVGPGLLSRVVTPLRRLWGRGGTGNATPRDP